MDVLDNQHGASFDATATYQFEKIAKLSARPIVTLGTAETAILESLRDPQFEVLKNLPEDLFLPFNAGTVTLAR